MPPHIAPEISDRIIDFLFSDSSSLLACSIVSKSWLITSRFHLLIQIRPKNCDGFVKLLDSPLSTLDLYISDVVIKGGPCPTSAARAAFKSAISSIRKLRSVQKLAVLNLDWLEKDSLISILSSFPDVKDFAIYGHSCYELSAITTILQQFPKLESVWLDSIEITDTSSLIHKIPHDFLPPSLRNLRVMSGTKKGPLFSLLSSPQLYPSPDFSSITLGRIHHEDAQSILHFLQALGPKLHSITVWVISLIAEFEHIENDILPALNLSFNTNLRSIFFDGIMFHHGEDIDYTFVARIFIALCKVASPLEEITFGIFATDDLDIHHFRLSELDRILQPNWVYLSHVRKVRFVISEFDSRCGRESVPVKKGQLERLEGIIRAFLPQCDRQGQLEFSFRSHKDFYPCLYDRYFERY